ncbi:ATP/GTP-binding protein [uncultured Jatrophihabitans sp.]|uniref:ATP/GTP-binding protein n=1 Tax=uncultured Jatrophihabitans sp. TaxID=1610747 RepID=UPI0035CAC1EE
MPRQNRRREAAPLATPRGGGERREDYQGLTYAVRAVSGQAAAKPYRCPGCDQEIRAGVPHLVCWPADDVSAEDRRHWHSACWAARGRRAPGVQRSRSAPRY